MTFIKYTPKYFSTQTISHLQYFTFPSKFPHHYFYYIAFNLLSNSSPNVSTNDAKHIARTLLFIIISLTLRMFFFELLQFFYYYFINRPNFFSFFYCILSFYFRIFLFFYFFFHFPFFFAYINFLSFFWILSIFYSPTISNNFFHIFPRFITLFVSHHYLIFFSFP